MRVAANEETPLLEPTVDAAARTERAAHAPRDAEGCTREDAADPSKNDER